MRLCPAVGLLLGVSCGTAQVPEHARTPTAAARSAMPAAAREITALAQGEFVCGAGRCSPGQICCAGYGDRCVTPPQALSAAPVALLAAAAEVVALCGPDSDSQVTLVAALCTASSDCGPGRYCMRQGSVFDDRAPIAFCTSSAANGFAEQCLDREPCAETGFVCELNNCVAANKHQCRGIDCAPGTMCCVPADSDFHAAACLRESQCATWGMGRLTYPCTRRADCAAGRQCLRQPAVSTTCAAITQLPKPGTGWGLCCESDVDCDVLSCQSPRAPHCLPEAFTALGVCECANESELEDEQSCLDKNETTPCLQSTGAFGLCHAGQCIGLDACRAQCGRRVRAALACKPTDADCERATAEGIEQCIETDCAYPSSKAVEKDPDDP